MKRTFFIVSGLILMLTRGASAQAPGLLIFTNDSTSIVTNSLTMAPVSTTDGIRVALYAGPDGADENSLIVVTSNVPVITPGHYNGGYRPMNPFMPSNVVMIQVRAYESTYGPSYEAASSAPSMNGRRALLGKSAVARVTLGGPNPSAQTPKVGALVGPITLFAEDGPPIITANDIAVSEGSNGVATATFSVRLLGRPTNEVFVDFATQDGTALADSDYIATSGTLTFLPGETVKSVAVTLLPDGPPEDVETFNLILSNPVNAGLVRGVIVCTIIEVRISSISVDTSVTFNTLAGKRYLLEKSIDMINWSPVAGATNLLGTGASLTVIDRGGGCNSVLLYRASVLLQ